MDEPKQKSPTQEKRDASHSALNRQKSVLRTGFWDSLVKGLIRIFRKSQHPDPVDPDISGYSGKMDQRMDIEVDRSSTGASDTAAAGLPATADQKMVTFSIRELLDQIFQHLEQSLNKRGLCLSMNLGKTIPAHLQGDELSIEKILTGLLVSAVGITREGGITITSLYHDQQLIFSIANTGAGFPEDQITLINEPLNEAKAFDSDSRMLDIKKMCIAVGAEIAVESEEKIGSVITVSFPVKPASQDVGSIPAGERMVMHWLHKYPQNPELALVFTKGLRYLKQEFHALQLAIENGNRHELLDKLHSIKGFPGGFGLTEIYKHLLIMEAAVQENPFDEKTLQQNLDALLELMDSIPSRYFSLDCLQTPESDRGGDETGPFSEYRILVAEDDQMNRELIAYVLKQLGIRFDMATNGEKALQMLKAEHYDLLLLDNRMPVMGGEETIRKIRGDKILKQLSVIAVTADIGPSDDLSLTLDGYDAVIAKPLDIEELSSAIKSLLSRCRSASPAKYCVPSQI